MADINVERKGPSIWPWIIGLIILALLIWWFVSRSGGERRAVPATTPADTVMVDTTAGMMTPAAPIGVDTAMPATTEPTTGH